MVRWTPKLLGFAVGLATAARAALPDWLPPVLTAEAQAFGKGAPSVCLLTSRDVHYTSMDRVRIVDRGVVRVATQSGRAEAVCGKVYSADTEKIVAARAWLVAADGREVRSFAIRDFADQVTKHGDVYWDRERVLRLSAAKEVAVGGVLAWEFEVESVAGIWDLHWSANVPRPTLVSRFAVAPAPGAKLEWHATEKSLGEPTPGAGGTLMWEWRKLTVVKPSEAPVGFVPKERAISVRAVPPGAPPRTWAGLARIFAEVVEPRVVPSADVSAKAIALTEGKTGSWERIRALTEFVQREIVYVGIQVDTDYLAGWRPHAPAEVLRNRYGDCKDKAALLVAMLRAIGEAGFLVSVSSGNPRAIDPEWPAARFNHAIAGIRAKAAAPKGWPVVTAGDGGEVVLFDPTDSRTPLGLLAEEDQGGFGLLRDVAGTGLVSMPVASTDTNRRDLRVRIALDAKGDASVETLERAGGHPGVARAARKGRWSEAEAKGALEERLHDTIATFADLRTRETWDAAKGEWTQEFSLRAPGYARPAGDGLLLVSPQAIWANPRLTPWKTKQAGSVWFPARHVHKEVRIALPSGAVVDEMPDEFEEKLGKASVHLRYRREGKSVVFTSDVKELAGFVDYDAYEVRRQLFLRAEEVERRRIVVRLAKP